MTKTEFTCPTCGETKLETEFRHDRSRKTGYRRNCKACESARRKEQRKQKQLAEATRQLLPEPPVIPTDGSHVEPEEIEKRARQLALLRLVQRHRTEFEYYIFDENRKLEKKLGLKTKNPTWISLSAAMEEDDDDTPPGNVLAG